MTEEYKKSEGANGRLTIRHAPNQDCDIHGRVNHGEVIRNGHQKSGEQEYKCNRCGPRFNRRKGRKELRKQKRTLAISAGLTSHIGSWEDVLLYHPNYHD